MLAGEEAQEGLYQKGDWVVKGERVGVKGLSRRKSWEREESQDEKYGGREKTVVDKTDRGTDYGCDGDEVGDEDEGERRGNGFHGVGVFGVVGLEVQGESEKETEVREPLVRRGVMESM